MTLSIGRVVLDEGPLRPFEENWSEDGREVTLTGIQHSRPSRPVGELAALHDDLLGLPMSMVPALFDVKSHRNGYYRVESAKSQIIELGDQEILQLAWEVGLIRQGADSEVDLESRLNGPVNRLNDHSLGGERWHAPAIDHSAYWADSESPGVVTRVGAAGSMRVYRALPITASPRWHCPVEDYAGGRVRVISPVERFGTNVDLDPSVWELTNDLLRIVPGGTGFDVFFHGSSAYGAAKRFNLTRNGTPLGTPLATSIAHNEYERVTLRCLWNVAPVGRVYADITLRRGSRFFEVVLKANVAATLGVVRATSEAASSGAGYVRATADDGDGHRYIIGSLRTFTGDLSAGGISLASTTRLDAMIGAEVGGSAAVAGDQADNLMAQYVGVPSEVVQAVRR